MKVIFVSQTLSFVEILERLDFPASPQLISFLHTFGASLESLALCLYLSDTKEHAEMLDVIQNNCRKL